MIGIDIGFETLKVVGLEKRGRRWYLQGLNIASIPHNSWQQNELTNQEELLAALKEVLRSAKPSPIPGKLASLALPESVIFSGTFSMPALSKKELVQAVPFEIAEKLSLNLEDYYFDYELVTTRCLPHTAQEGRRATATAAKTEAPAKQSKTEPVAETPLISIFAVATRKSLVQSIMELCQKAGLELVGIGIKPAAIARAVIRQDDLKARAIIDLGTGSTGASISEGKSIRVTSTVPWGAKELLSATHTPEEIVRELTPVFDEFLHITKFFENRVCPGTKIEEVILSGSGTNIPNVVELFKQQTGLPTVISDPFWSVDTHRFPVPPAVGHTFGDAVGLAMRSRDG